MSRTRRGIGATAIVIVVIPMLGTSAAQESPGARYGHDMVFDERREVALLFGGFGPDGEALGDTWSWNGESWSLVTRDGPPPRRWPALAYDSKRASVVLFGGRSGKGRSGASLADTWIWDGSEWRARDVPGPSARDHHRMVYDRKRDRLVLFGGWDGERVVGDTWEWDGRQWRLASADGPAPRAPFGIAYHEARDRVLLVGGQDLEQTFDDSWIWDGSEWSELDGEGPGARGFHTMTYDSGRERIVVYGGRDGDRLLQDLWSWDGQRWEMLADGGPRRRGVYSSAYDRSRGELVIHGSGDLVNGAWILEATTLAWTQTGGWKVIYGDER